jgi:type IV secretory pathway VirD2 relaxase
MRDDEFEPRLGRMRATGAKRARRYLHRVIAAAGSGVKAGGKRFCGSRIGRGAVAGRLLASRSHPAGLRLRRAIIKTRLVRLGRKGAGAARAHLRYIQRGGVQRDGSPGRLYSAAGDDADGKAFLERCDGDRHQFRLIVSAEDGADYDDLKPLIRRFMAQMEKDLGTPLDWVAVDHLDTAHPHTHVMMRGKNELGQNLVIAREYISRGMRERLAELIALDLGPRSDLEIEQKLRRDIGAERLTATDRSLIRGMDEHRHVAAGHLDPFKHALRVGRLRKLEALGLADHLAGDRWRLAEGLEERLRQLGERGDIIRTMQRALKSAGVERGPSDRLIHEGRLSEAIIGRVVARGLLDELADRHYLIVDGIDGRAHHIDIGRGDATEASPKGSIVRIAPALRR